MARTLRVATLALAAAAFVAAPAIGDGHGTYVDPCADQHTVAVGPFYVSDGNKGTWVYQESNGLAGLQRGGVTPAGADLGGDDRACQHYWELANGEKEFVPADTAIF